MHIIIIVTSIITVDRAFTSGVTPVLTIAIILIGSVVLPGPHVKKLIITSSNDNENASMAPDVIPGISRGKVICIKVLTLLAPKSIAASSKDLSNPANLALTFITTNGMENVI